jgi:hypothetical protein
MTKDEALDLALEALELNNDEWKSLAASGDCGYWNAEDQDHYKQTNKAITAIKKAQPAPVQEPVAYWIPKAEQFCIADPSGRPFAKAWEPLYTTPPAAQRQWVEVEQVKWDGEKFIAKLKENK